VFVEYLPSPSIKQPGEITSEPPAPTTQIMVITRSWTQDFIDHIRENKLPSNKEEATRIIRRSKNYVLIGDHLYRRAASSGALLKCVSREEEKKLLMKFTQVATVTMQPQGHWWAKLFVPVSIGQQL
jgi:hypothetical protein